MAVSRFCLCGKYPLTEQLVWYVTSVLNRSSKQQRSFMILFVQSVKMAVSRQESTIQVEEEFKMSWLQKVARMVSVRESKRQAVGDVMVAIVALPLLITCSVMLHTSMRSDWIKDVKMRWRILGLGLTLLFASLLVCLYATHRLGLCIWKSQQQPVTISNRIRRRTVSSRGVGLPAPLIATDSEMRLVVGNELPPSYDSVISHTDLPPPYTSVIIQDEKTEVSRSFDGPRIVVTAPPGTG